MIRIIKESAFKQRNGTPGSKMMIMALAPTSLMTLFMNLCSEIFKRHLKVVRILGVMLSESFDDRRTYNKRPKMLGTIVHYFIGAMFTLVYVFAWKKFVGGETARDILTFGAAAGLIGVIVWRLFFSVHGNTLNVSLPLYLTCIFLGHLVFAGGLYLFDKFIES